MSNSTRPYPPLGLGEYQGDVMFNFAPAADVGEWVTQTFLTEGGDLYNEDHKHLEYADIAFLWAAGGFVKQMRAVIGQCEEVSFRAGPWQKGRQVQQMHGWFGRTPKYLITLDANYCTKCSDIEFCALVEHELYHIAHAKDEFGAPGFTKDGMPKLAMRGHDVEEFVGVVQRYGGGSPDGAIAQMVKAAKDGPTVGRATISHACGTCLLKAA